MKQVLIYSGEGTCQNGIAHLQKRIKCSSTLVDAHFLLENKWQSTTDLIVFPGGRDIPYHNALAGHANKHIREFVQNGGRYLGICAGAYYASSQIEFEKGFRHEVCQSRELAFFPGIARGPVFGQGQYSYEDRLGACQVELMRCDGAKATSYYYGGCAFINPEQYQNVRVLAHYHRECTDPLAAVVQCRVGRGMVILSGVHPEYNNDPLFDWLIIQMQKQ